MINKKTQKADKLSNKKKFVVYSRRNAAINKNKYCYLKKL